MAKLRLFVPVFIALIIILLPAIKAEIFPGCDDGIMNGDETGIDCGGSCVTADPELCNGIDDNHDCAIDEGLFLTYYLDSDGDGFGNSAISTIACSQPLGAVLDNTDCDDTNPKVFPGNQEVCNSIDDNCDSQIDEGVKGTYFRDFDGDGFGNPSASISSCSKPADYVIDNADCDDLKVNVHPGAQELCDGKDNDCDGLTDGQEGLTRQCGTSDLAACTFGTETCNDAGSWVGCTAVMPQEDIPDNGIDENCDGVDQHCEIVQLSGDYNTRRVPLQVNCDLQYKSIQYSINNKRFIPACPRCKQYNGQITPAEGQNSLTVLIQGYNDQTHSYPVMEFFVDSIKPTIIKVAPSSGYTDGVFTVTYSEDNLKTATLFYRGVGGDWKQELPREDCPKGKNKICQIKGDNLVDGMDYEYYFTLEDVAGNKAQSRIFMVKADVIIPELIIATPFNGVYSTQAVLFDLLSTEKGIIGYIENGIKPKEVKLCQNCAAFKKNVNMQAGWHDITLFARDNVGHMDTENVKFLVDFTKPTIISLDPTKGFASGAFNVKYTEINCNKIKISIIGHGQISINRQGHEASQDFACASGQNIVASLNMDLSSFKGEKIDYTVTISDAAGNSASKTAKGLTV